MLISRMPSKATPRTVSTEEILSLRTTGERMGPSGKIHLRLDSRQDAAEPTYDPSRNLRFASKRAQTISRVQGPVKLESGDSSPDLRWRHPPDAATEAGFNRIRVPGATPADHKA